MTANEGIVRRNERERHSTVRCAKCPHVELDHVLTSTAGILRQPRLCGAHTEWPKCSCPGFIPVEVAVPKEVRWEDYQVCIMEAAIPADVVAVEHNYGGDKLCLVASSTLTRTLVEIHDAIELHNETCEHAR